MTYCTKLVEWVCSFFPRITNQTPTPPMVEKPIIEKPFSTITLFLSAHGFEDSTTPLHEYHEIDTRLLQEQCTILSVAGTWNSIGIMSATSLIQGLSLSENMLYVASGLFTKEKIPYTKLLQECCRLYRIIIGHALTNMMTIGPTTPAIIIHQYIQNKWEERGDVTTILTTWLRQHLPKRLHSSIPLHINAIHTELVMGYDIKIPPAMLIENIVKRISCIHPKAFLTSSQFIELYRQKDSEWYSLIGSYLSNNACTLIRPYYNKTYQFYPNERKEEPSLRPHYGIHLLQLQSSDGKQWIPPLTVGKPTTHNLISYKCKLGTIHPAIATLHSAFSGKKQCSFSLYELLVQLQPLVDNIVLLDTSCRSDITEHMSQRMEKRIRNAISEYEKI